MNRIDLAEELTAELQQGVFSSATDLSAWLSSRGYAIASTPTQGSLFPLDNNVRLLSSYRRASGKPPIHTGGDVTNQILTLMQEKLLLALESSDHMSLAGVNIAALGRMVSEITKASILQKRYNTEMMERAHRAVHDVQKVAIIGGLSEDAVDIIKRRILGIVS